MYKKIQISEMKPSRIEYYGERANLNPLKKKKNTSKRDLLSEKMERRNLIKEDLKSAIQYQNEILNFNILIGWLLRQ